MDPHIPLAMALHHRPGSYAVLLGSGISSAAKIPTGWDIEQRLARSVAAAQQIETDDPLAWYHQEFGGSPTYSGLLDELGHTEADRQAIVLDLLTSNTKAFPAPTAAHRAIARLAAADSVKIILTTNFDPLLEEALAGENVHFTVLSSESQIEGALPLALAGTVVVKLHGDYRDVHIRNTEAELKTYPQAVNNLLQRVFDDYGLVICGWSAKHDVALRTAIERSTNRRFTTYWTTLGGELEPSAQPLVEHRDAQVVPIVDADDFFGRLSDAVRSLHDLDFEPAESPATVVATLKRDLGGGSAAITAHDRVRQEISKASRFSNSLDANNANGAHERRRATPAFEMLAATTATTAYWGDETSDQWWINEITQFTRQSGNGGNTSVLDLAKVPGLIMIWAAGIAAIASGRDDLLARLLSLPPAPVQWSGKVEPPLNQLDVGVLHLNEPVAWLFHRLRPTFAEHLALGIAAYAEAFDRWQYVLAVTDLVRQTGGWLGSRLLIVDDYDPMRPVSRIWFEGTLRHGTTHPLVQSGVAGSKDEAAVDLLRTASETVANNYAAIARDADLQVLRGASGGFLPSSRHYPGSFSDDPDVAIIDPEPPSVT